MFSILLLSSFCQMKKRTYLSLLLPVFISLFSACSQQAPGDRDTSRAQELKKLDDSAMYWSTRNLDSMWICSSKLLREATFAGSTRWKAKGLMKVGVYHSHRGATDTAISYFQKALSIADSINDTLTVENTHNYLAGCFFERGLFEKASKGYEKALSIARERSDSVNMARYYNNLGSVAEQSDRLELAQKYINNSIRITEKRGDTLTLATSLRNLAYIIRKTGDSSMAGNYLRRSLDLFTRLPNLRWMAVLFSDLGIHFRYAQPDSSRHYYNKARDIYIHLQDEGNLMITEFNMANLLIDASRYREAEHAFMKIYLASARQNNLIGIAYSSISLAQAFTGLKDYHQAMRYITIAESSARQWGQPAFTMEVYMVKVGLLKAMGNYKESTAYLEKYIHLKDSVEESVDKSRILEMQKQFDDERLAFTISSLRQESQIQQAQLRSRKMVIIGLSGFITVIVILLLIIYKYYRKMAAANDKLIRLSSELLEEVEKRKRAEQILKEKERELIRINASKDKFLSILAHDLKSPFNTIFGFTDLLAEDLPGLSREEIVDRLERIGNSAKQAYALLENLLIWAQSQRGLLQYSPEVIDLKSHLAENIAMAHYQAGQKKISLNIDFPEGIRIMADRNMCSTIFRNLLSNAIKFTYPGGHVEITARTGNGKAIIDVKDNGIGLTTQQMSEIFRIETMQRTLGTAKEKGSGLGLILCKDFAETQGGTIRVESEAGKGSVFSVELPLAESGEQC